MNVRGWCLGCRECNSLVGRPLTKHHSHTNLHWRPLERSSCDIFWETCYRLCQQPHPSCVLPPLPPTEGSEWTPWLCAVGGKNVVKSTSAFAHQPEHTVINFYTHCVISMTTEQQTLAWWLSNKVRPCPKTQLCAFLNLEHVHASFDNLKIEVLWKLLICQHYVKLLPQHMSTTSTLWTSDIMRCANTQ